MFSDPHPPTGSSVAPPNHDADINRSPTLLLSSLFAAQRSGDHALTRFYRRRLKRLGIHVTFACALPTAPETEEGLA